MQNSKKEQQLDAIKRKSLDIKDGSLDIYLSHRHRTLESLAQQQLMQDVKNQETNRIIVQTMEKFAKY